MIEEINIRLPDWAVKYFKNAKHSFGSIESKMQFTIDLARQNIAHDLGGPFSASVFDHKGHLISIGMNLVWQSNCSIWHAEVVALALAQKTVGRYDLSDNGRYCFELFASCEPCAMCFGAIPWSGIGSLVCGARDEDARNIGFDEGPKLPDWDSQLNKRGIRVTRDVLRVQAQSVLQDYVAQGGMIYNAGPK